MRARMVAAATVFSHSLWLLAGYVFAVVAASNIAFAALVIVGSFYACVRLVRQRFTSEGRKRLADSRKTSVSGTVGALLELVALGTAGFAALSALLFTLGVGTLKGGPLHGQALADASYTYYLWHLADAIPLLKVPETLNWTLRHPYTDHVHGGLALIYAITVVVPMVYGATQVISGWTSDQPREPRSPDPPGTAASRAD